MPGVCVVVRSQLRPGPQGRFPPKRCMVTEEQLAQSTLDLLRLFGWQVFRNRDSTRRVADGVIGDSDAAGEPDLRCFSPSGLFVALELKSNTGQLRPKQAEFVRWAHTRNAPVGVLRPHRFDAFANIIKARFEKTGLAPFLHETRADELLRLLRLTTPGLRGPK